MSLGKIHLTFWNSKVVPGFGVLSGDETRCGHNAGGYRNIQINEDESRVTCTNCLKWIRKQRKAEETNLKRAKQHLGGGE